MTYGDVRDVLATLPHHSDGTAYWRDPELFPVKHRLIAELDPPPRSVFEFGALLGFFLVTTMDAAPIRRVKWFDNQSHTPGSNLMCAENLQHYALTHGHMAVVETLAERPVRHPPRVDLVHVDADHSQEACLGDLLLAEACLGDLLLAARMKPQTILVDDYTAETHATEIQAAVEAFLTWPDGQDFELEEVATTNGLAVLRRRRREEA